MERKNRIMIGGIPQGKLSPRVFKLQTI